VLGEAHPYTKTRALQVFLCGRPLFSTLILITPYSASFLCSEDEAANLVSLAHLPQDRNEKIDVKVIVKPTKLAAANLAMEAFLTSIEQVTLKTGKKVGCLRDGEPMEDDFMV
jgi:nucleosome binding factor SPN SPT16 subunit